MVKCAQMRLPPSSAHKLWTVIKCRQDGTQGGNGGL